MQALAVAVVWIGDGGIAGRAAGAAEGVGLVSGYVGCDPISLRDRASWSSGARWGDGGGVLREMG